MNNDFEWKWNDPSHFEAHREEFSRPVEEILEELRPRLLDLSREVRAALQGAGLAGPTDRRLWVHEEWELSAPTGASGLRRVEPGSADAFWAYRSGRSIPSHLTLGSREETSWVCLWGWAEGGQFVIHTIYPGRKAPREIHDPGLALSELPEAIEFWRAHAIVATEGAFAFEPASE